MTEQVEVGHTFLNGNPHGRASTMFTQGFARRFLLASSLFSFTFALLFLVSDGYAFAATMTIGWQPSNSNTYQAVYLNSSTSGNYIEGEANPDPKMYGPSATIDEWSGTYTNTDDHLTVNYDIHFDADPVVVLFFALQNTGTSTSSYTMAVSQPVAIGSSVGSGSTGWSLTALSGTATLDTPSASALYNAQINGTTVQTLFPFGAAPPPFMTSTSGTINDAFSGQSEGSASSIGIFDNFTLTPGDQVSSTNIFRLDALAPEPASITLSLLGLLGVPLAFRLRRR